MNENFIEENLQKCDTVSISYFIIEILYGFHTSVRVTLHFVVVPLAEFQYLQEGLRTNHIVVTLSEDQCAGVWVEL